MRSTKKKLMGIECTGRVTKALTADISEDLNCTLGTNPITTIHPNPHYREFKGIPVQDLSLAVGWVTDTKDFSSFREMVIEYIRELNLRGIYV